MLVAESHFIFLTAGSFTTGFSGMTPVAALFFKPLIAQLSEA